MGWDGMGWEGARAGDCRKSSLVGWLGSVEALAGVVEE